ncbi:hypothetical protein L3X38_039487 [Prunus dulcis]|uniref:Uncharacterized protein n=1 Tax=Prunus dulcis TaxID=3755 RepID=A0AAD4YSM1_PRUDU|nr:hypothetical protein L3X38_039487 [Prunus dulcis]
MVGAFFWGIFAVFSPYCPSAGFYNLWGQPTSNFKRLCDFERDGERERGREGGMDGWMDGVWVSEGRGWSSPDSAGRSELDVVGTSC